MQVLAQELADQFLAMQVQQALGPVAARQLAQALQPGLAPVRVRRQVAVAWAVFQAPQQVQLVLVQVLERGPVPAVLPLQAQEQVRQPGPELVVAQAVPAQQQALELQLGLRAQPLPGLLARYPFVSFSLQVRLDV